MILASCKRVYFLSDLAISAPHNTVKANASQTVRLMAWPDEAPHTPIQVRLAALLIAF
jgi:hypothetical protein